MGMVKLASEKTRCKCVAVIYPKNKTSKSNLFFFFENIVFMYTKCQSQGQNKTCIAVVPRYIYDK